jgi:hypothetical protein
MNYNSIFDFVILLYSYLFPPNEWFAGKSGSVVMFLILFFAIICIALEMN